MAVAVKVEQNKAVDWSKVKPLRELSTFLVDSKFHGLVKSNGDSRKIFGGKDAIKNQFPYQVGLVMLVPGSEGSGLCGGSLISSTRVLTAAHCIKIASSAYVELGAHMLFGKEDRTNFLLNASEFIVHPDYDKATNQNDIGMIKLPSEVKFNDLIKPIALAKGSNDFAGYIAVLSGWGNFDSRLVHSPSLRFANLEVITNEECRKKFTYFIHDSTICANGEGAVGGCFGDSGGPLTVQSNGQSLLVGVASFVSKFGCDQGIPNGFTRVSSFIPWIESNM